MTTARLDGGSVLIIDGDDSIRNLIATLLGRAGFTTHAVADGAAAAALTGRFDVVIRDVNLAPCSREKAIRELQQTAPDVLRRTVVITTSSGAILRHAALEGVFAVVRKPFDVDELLETVRHCRDASPARGRKTHREERGRPAMSVVQVLRFVQEVPRLRALLAGEPHSTRELLVRNQMRRTALELASVLHQAARVEGDRRRAAVLLGAARDAAELGGRARGPHSTPRNH